MATLSNANFANNNLTFYTVPRTTLAVTYTGTRTIASSISLTKKNLPSGGGIVTLNFTGTIPAAGVLGTFTLGAGTIPTGYRPTVSNLFFVQGSNAAAAANLSCLIGTDGSVTIGVPAVSAIGGSPTNLSAGSNHFSSFCCSFNVA